MIKLRVDVVEDIHNPGKYKVQKWVFEKKTGRTLQHYMFKPSFSKADAIMLKRDIINSYKEM